MKTYFAVFVVVWAFAALFGIFYLNGGLTHAMVSTAACLFALALLLAAVN